MIDSVNRNESEYSPGYIRNSKCFISKEEKRTGQEDRFIILNKPKESRKIETKIINKQTIELREEFNDLIPRHKTLEREHGKHPKR
jgi:hypothetical protein